MLTGRERAEGSMGLVISSTTMINTCTIALCLHEESIKVADPRLSNFTDEEKGDSRNKTLQVMGNFLALYICYYKLIVWTNC